MPPDPVVLLTPAPARLNHVSIVNVTLPSSVACPNVTKSSVPSKASAPRLDVPEHVSVVQALASSQELDVPVQAPPTH